MSFSVLSQASALNPGSDLWIVPDLEKSQWTAKLDWYLNFQICKSTRHETPSIENHLTEILSETGLSESSLNLKKTAPLMISSHQLLPNKWVVVVPWTNDMEKWMGKIDKIFTGLKQPSIRVFLPPGQSAGNFQTAWSAFSSHDEYTLVLD